MSFYRSEPTEIRELNKHHKTALGVIDPNFDRSGALKALNRLPIFLEDGSGRTILKEQWRSLGNLFKDKENNVVTDEEIAKAVDFIAKGRLANGAPLSPPSASELQWMAEIKADREAKQREAKQTVRFSAALSAASSNVVSSSLQAPAKLDPRANSEINRSLSEIPSELLKKATKRFNPEKAHVLLDLQLAERKIDKYHRHYQSYHDLLTEQLSSFNKPLEIAEVVISVASRSFDYDEKGYKKAVEQLIRKAAQTNRKPTLSATQVLIGLFAGRKEGSVKQEAINAAIEQIMGDPNLVYVMDPVRSSATAAAQSAATDTSSSSKFKMK